MLALLIYNDRHELIWQNPDIGSICTIQNGYATQKVHRVRFFTERGDITAIVISTVADAALTSCHHEDDVIIDDQVWNGKHNFSNVGNLVTYINLLVGYKMLQATLKHLGDDELPPVKGAEWSPDCAVFRDKRGNWRYDT